MKNIPHTKNICKDRTGFSIYKMINGKQKHLGHAKTLIMALMIRDWCMANDWKRYPYHEMKYIYQDPRTGHYQILKQWGSPPKKIIGHYGSFKDLNQAKEYRDLCIEKEWDEQLMPCNNPLAVNPLKYIQKTPSGNYRIEKWINMEMVHYGTYSNIIDAINERDLLLEHNWDLDKVCELTDDTISGIEIMRNRRV